MAESAKWEAMQQIEQAGEGPDEPILEETDVYKATSSSDFVIRRRLRLYRTRFVTYHNIEENEGDNKTWLISSSCELQPRTAAEIKEPVKKYVRPRGQWAITTLVKPKSSASKGKSVLLYLFSLSWPTRWKAKGYTSFTFGFLTPEEARHWHARISACMEAARLDKLAARQANLASAALPLNPGSSAAGSYMAPGSEGGERERTSRLMGVRSSAGGWASLVKSSSVTPKGMRGIGSASVGGMLQSTESLPPGQGAPPSPGISGGESGGDGYAVRVRTSRTGPASGLGEVAEGDGEAGHHRRSKTAMSEPASAPVSSNSPSLHGVPGAPVQSHGDALAPSPFFAAGSNASTALRAAAPADAANMARESAPTTVHARSTRPVANGREQQQQQHLDVSRRDVSHNSHKQSRPHTPHSHNHGGGYYTASSSEDEEEMEDADEGLAGAGAGPGRLGAGGSSGTCRQSRTAERADVRHANSRWVPQRQESGLAIYYRPQTKNDNDGEGGEFLVSTVVRGPPRRCLEVLLSSCARTTILGPALRQEVLQRRHADDQREIQRIVLQATGWAGVLCAPREMVVETVFKTDESGPTLELMFRSCQPPPVEGTAAAQGQHPQGEEGACGADVGPAVAQGSRRSWWGRPVVAQVQGSYSIAPLEDHSLEGSPESLVTCIIKVDLGGVCGERSWLRLVSQAAGWTNAFLDRLLMAVILLRDEVEQSRFAVQPITTITASSVKGREVAPPAPRGRQSTELALPGSGALPGGSSAVAVPAWASSAAPEAAGGGRKTCGSVQTCLLAAAQSAIAAAVGTDDEAASRAAIADVSAASSSLCAAATAAVTPGLGPCEDMLRGGETLGAAADVPRPLGAPCEQQYETMEQVLARMKQLSLLDTKVWDCLHQPGKDAPFKVRGPTYLKDRKKIPAGNTRFVLGSMDVIAQPPAAKPHEHIARFLPSVRQSGAPFSLIIHLVIPGTPLLGIVAVFVSDRHPGTLGTPPAQPMDEDHDWEPFDFVLHKYMTGSTHTRNHMLKLIPHIADGSWMIKQSVGTTPVILGKQLRTVYYETPQYIEIDIDISANAVASYVTGLVRGATRSLVIDMGFVLEGTTPWELPEALLGTLRLYNLDTRKAVLIDVDNEIPLRPPTVRPYQPPPSRQQQQRCSPPPPTPPAGASPLRAGRRGSPSGGAGGGDVNGEEERASPGGLGQSSGHTAPLASPGGGSLSSPARNANGPAPVSGASPRSPGPAVTSSGA